MLYCELYSNFYLTRFLHVFYSGKLSAIMTAMLRLEVKSEDWFKA